MQAVRFLYDSTLPANVTNADGAELDSLNHGFQSAYLKSTTSKNKVLDDIESQLGKLVDPAARASSGPITVTLEWGEQPDVDLHIFEPGDFHVYYGEPVGDVGSLDVDDKDGHGPEHYVADCDRLVPGTYVVGVNYFYGDGIVTAHVAIKAGSIVKNY